MNHSFIYTTENVENCPKQLYCGFEVIDGMLKTILDDGSHVYLETLIRKSLIDPTTFPDWLPPVEEEETAEEEQ